MQIGQIELIAAIMKHLDKQGAKLLNPRQVNAIIDAANRIVDAVATAHRPAVAQSGLSAWLASDETGESSLTMARKLAPLIGFDRHISGRDTHPHDPSDFGRCVGLLDAAPGLRAHIKEMRKVSPVWARLADEWGSLESLYREELPRGKAPKLYARMRAILEATP